MIFSRRRGNASRPAASDVTAGSGSSPDRRPPTDQPPPEFGPYDITQAPDDDRARLDLGALAGAGHRRRGDPAAGRAAGPGPAGAARPRGEPAAVGRLRRPAPLGHLGRDPGRDAWPPSTRAAARPREIDGEYGPEVRARLARPAAAWSTSAMSASTALVGSCTASTSARPRSIPTGPGRCARCCTVSWSTGARRPARCGRRCRAAAARGRGAARRGGRARTATGPANGQPPDRRAAAMTARRDRRPRHDRAPSRPSRPSPATARPARAAAAVHRRPRPSWTREELRAETAAAGCTPVRDARRGQLVSVTGRLRTVVYTPRTNLPTLEADLYDGSDVVTLVWLGRRQIAGIEPGRALTARGRVGVRDDRKVIYNPYYELDRSRSAGRP